MNDHAILPFLSQFDPPQQAEGSLDPLGLYSIADALGVRLAPGVRERQFKPRYLTLALVGMAACNDSAVALGEEKRIPAWLAYEWLVVEALVRRADGGKLTGVPGQDKVRTSIENGERICASNYLKTPSVFGFHGVYRVLGQKAGLFDGNGHPLEHGFRVLSAWQEEQGLKGFAEGQGEGRDFRMALERAVLKSIEAGFAHDPGSKVSKMIADHLNPHGMGNNERDALWSALMHNDESRNEYATLLVSQEGQGAWVQAAGSEADFHQWLSQAASKPMQTLLAAIRSYEYLSRLLTDAFDEARWRMAEAKSLVDHSWLAQGAAMKEAAKRTPSAFSSALAHLGEVDPLLRQKAERAFDWIGESRSPKAFSEQLFLYHKNIQGKKPPNGKRAWVDEFGDGRIAIRQAYTVKEFEPRPAHYVHAYRTKPIWSFACDLGRVNTTNN